MSQANVDLVESIIEGFAARKPRTDLIADDLEYVNPPYAVESGVRRDRQALNGVFDVYPDFRFEPQRYVDVGHDVLVIGVARGTSTSGVKAQWKQGHIWTIRDGRAIRFRWFSDPDEALRDAIAGSFRNAMEAYSRGEFDTALAAFHPDIEWSVDASMQPDPETFRGHEGVQRFWSTWGEVIDEMRLEVEECRALDERQVLAITRAHGRGAGSGAEVQSSRFAELAEFEDGLVVRVRLFASVRQALAAAGLEELADAAQPPGGGDVPR
jgi:ketosteroid isomerase-like protein